MHSDDVADAAGGLTIREPVPGVVEVTVRGRLSREVGAAFPRYADALSRRRERCSVFLDVRGLEAFEGAVRTAWLDAVLQHRSRIDEVVVLSKDLLVTLSARAAAVALSPFGVRFEVFTDERRYLARRAHRVGLFADPAPGRSADTLAA